MICAALIGCPNCGKTTLFNRLTGANERVGNFSGVTVDAAEGVCRVGGEKLRIVDLPGIRSLKDAGAEERAVTDFLASSSPDVIICVADVSRLNAALSLLAEAAETGAPMVLALNMYDELERDGGFADIAELERLLDMPVIPISAAYGKGVDALLRTALHSAQNGRLEKRVISDERIAACIGCVHKSDRALNLTERLDRLLCRPIIALPLFYALMLSGFLLSFGKIGQALSELVLMLFDRGVCAPLSALLAQLEVFPLLRVLVEDGVMRGTGAVLGFFPQLILLFLFMGVLEESGYLARTAFISDRLLCRLGLSGRAFVPLLMGFSCSVPALMSARTVGGKRARILTLILIPFMSCSAKMPVYAYIASAFFPEHGALFIGALYITGVVFALLTALILSRTLLRGGGEPLLLEMPLYRMPRLNELLRRLRLQALEFLERTATVILLSSTVLGLLNALTPSFSLALTPQESIIHKIGEFIAPVFAPCGFGNAECAVSLVSGLTAKESIISALTVLGGDIHSLLTPAQAAAFTIFVLLYSPCTAAVSAMRRELNSTPLTALLMLIYTLIAWISSMALYHIALLFG